MILTGKAKEDFENSIDHFLEVLLAGLDGQIWSLPNEWLYAEIIKWFDSVGININTTPFDYEINSGLWEEIKSYKNIVDYNRTEVQRLAIEKVNEIYNSKFNK